MVYTNRLQTKAQLFNCAGFISILCTAWVVAILLAQTTVPLVIVTSQSMEPTFTRGDLLVVSNRKTYVEAGDITVCWFQGHPMPMVHRAIQAFYRPDNDGQFEQYILTKGDNNALTDETLYPKGQKYVYRDQVVGLVKGYIPYIGWIAILLQENWWLKFAVLGAMGFAAVKSKE